MTGGKITNELYLHLKTLTQQPTDSKPSHKETHFLSHSVSWYFSILSQYGEYWGSVWVPESKCACCFLFWLHEGPTDAIMSMRWSHGYLWLAAVFPQSNNWTVEADELNNQPTSTSVALCCVRCTWELGRFPTLSKRQKWGAFKLLKWWAAGLLWCIFLHNWQTREGKQTTLTTKSASLCKLLVQAGGDEDVTVMSPASELQLGIPEGVRGQTDTHSR